MPGYSPKKAGIPVFLLRKFCWLGLFEFLRLLSFLIDRPFVLTGVELNCKLVF